MTVTRSEPRKLKILVSLLYYHPHSTGLTIYVQHVAEELVCRGHEVTVLTARYDRSLPRDEQMHNGVRVVRLWTLPFTISRGMLMPAWPWAALMLALQHDVLWGNVPMLETVPLALVSPAWQARCRGDASRRPHSAGDSAQPDHQQPDVSLLHSAGVPRRPADHSQ